jgi:hypothetical protein
LVISQGLAGPVGLFIKFSQLQEYGVDRVFLLENGNVDSSQRNVVFLAYAEKIRQVRTVAGMSESSPSLLYRIGHKDLIRMLLYGKTVDYADRVPTLRIHWSSPDGDICLAAYL